MKSILPIAAIALLLVNVLCAAVLSFYPTHIAIASSVCIIFNAGLIRWLTGSACADGFKIGLSSLLSISFLVKLPLCLFLKKEMENNLALIVLVAICLMELALCIFIIRFKGETSGPANFGEDSPKEEE